MPLDMRSRHAAEAPQMPQGFRCPQCGAENTGPIEEGCAHCGSGTQKAAHKEAEPAPAKVDLLAGAPEPTQAPWAAALKDYLGWYDNIDPPERTLASEAFICGWKAAMQAIGVGQTNSAAGALPGTAESRTLLVALRILRDEVYSQHPEETTNGEWLTPQELDALIKKLEG